MASRKDLLKAHSFITQRLHSALINRDPDDVQKPLRRVGTGTFIGIMIGVLVMAGFGIVGLLTSGGTSNWQEDNTVIIDETSGGVYAFVGGKLYPTANIASARLVTGNADSPKGVKAKSLQGFPQEHMIGIPDAPAALPAADSLNAYPLRVCATRPDGEDRRFTTLEIAGATVPDHSSAFAVRDSRGTEYLVVDGRAHRVPLTAGQGRSAVLIELGFTEIMTPGDAFIRALPQGTPLGMVEIPNLNEQSNRPIEGVGNLVGTVVRVEAAAGDAYYVLLRDGLARIKPLDARFMALEQGVDVQTIDSTTASQSTILSQTLSAEDIPNYLPAPDQQQPNLSTATACATWTSPTEPPLMALGVLTPNVNAEAPAGQADAVVIPAMSGALVRNEGAAADGSPMFLLTAGRAYGIPDKQSRDALGYGGAEIQEIPPQLLSLVPNGLPAGVTLSVEFAKQPVTSGDDDENG
ncbi:type VII secretion protein EccB [Parenemella sanctibonifatiensis]|uniref:Type VII secretion protein EccB n=1 Tax=Parenemella sanctibonifatiensis TaxID=2016505 RepID=A0A255EX85_9ACTN|nr:type VII secretion protein EccB [Parenemella sanctibonifatiensis]OYN92743.1 type VII secretion protein EccB [Parenemella sanctibonifatiensis]